MENAKNPLTQTSSLPAMMPSTSEDNTGPTEPVDNAICDDEPNDIYDRMLDLEETMEDVIVLENEKALFECKVLKDHKPKATWYKDGNLLQSDEKTTITQDATWHRLEVKQVTASDQGIYAIEFRHKRSYISIKGHLYVTPRSLNDGVFYQKIKYQETGVIKHMNNIKVLEGETIVLKAEFKYASEVYLWFKNNIVVTNSQRKTILNNATITSLTIKNAKPTDCGVYFVVAKTVQGCLSSFADVIVGDVYEKRPFLPIIEEYLPDELEALVGEEMRLLIKAQTDMGTIIKWEKNNVEIETNDCKRVDYGNNYIGLTLLNPTMSSVGKYRVSLVNGLKERSSVTRVNFSLTVAPEPLQEVELVLPLESAVACCGSKVSFDCSFDLKDPTYFYVVWYIGHYKVERTNSLFNVVWSGAHFMLYIKKLEPSMAGEVICELRRAFPDRKSVMIKRVYANLVMVPLAIIQAAKQEPVLYSKLYYKQEIQDISTRIEVTDSATRSVADIDTALVFDLDTDFLLKIVFCRLDEDGLYFLHATRGRDTSVTTQLTVYENPVTCGTVTVIRWADSLSPVSSWYSIEIGQANGSFAEAGSTSQPQFELANPPLDRMLIFRIKLVQPMNQAYDSKIFIVAPPEYMPPLTIPHEILSMNSYTEQYTETSQVIGKGAFGTVKLIRDKNGIHYAAKIVKPRAGKKIDHVLREFHIMKKLRHPKIIQLIHFYASMYVVVFVMEYYWGGELFDRIVGEEYLSEVDVVYYLKQICEGLEYMHSNSIVHLDLKPENIICTSPNSRQIKLIDFGLARIVNEESTRVVYGTRDYIAPEIIELEPISTASDMWSLGVVTYTLLSGLMPFTGENWVERSINITRAAYNFDDFAFNDVSDLAKNFVNRLLVRRTSRRMSASGAIQHKWIQEGPPKGTKTKHMTQMRENLKSYLADYRARWQRAGNVVIAAQRLRMMGRQDPPNSEETPKPVP